MPKCISCNIRYKSSQLDANHFCRSCLSEKEKKSERLLKDNLATLCEGRGKDEFQRIFDAFVRTYPEALITGVGCNSECHHLLVYLDEKPMYFATFDPLKNSVILEAYDAPAVTPAPKKNYGAIVSERANTLACAVSLFSFIGSLILFFSPGFTITAVAYGLFSLIALFASARNKGDTSVIGGVLMVIVGMLSDPLLIIPGLLIIYGGMRF